MTESTTGVPAAPAFRRLPLGATHPTGWLRYQLQLQAAGLTGHLGEVWPDVGPNSAWLGGGGEDWERGPYYADGLIPLAYLLGEPGLVDLAGRWVDGSLQSQTPDGFFGPRTNDDWWPRMVMLKALTQHQEATGDPRVIPFLERYAAHQAVRLPERPLTSWGWARGAENLLTVQWLYQRTADPQLLGLADRIIAQTLDWGAYFVEFPCRSKYTAGFDHHTHVVNVAMGLKEPATRQWRDGDPRHRAAVDAALANLDRYHGQATGMFSGDEWLAGRDPSQGVELCAVVEMMFSLEQLLAVYGDAGFADRLERIAYNNLPATLSPDLRAHQYDQQWNQVLCSVAPRAWTANRDDSNLFGLEPNFGCCTANLHQGWPKLAASLWLGTPDGGLAAAVYAPCQVQTRLGASAVTIDETTDYPFGDTVRLRVHLSSPATFLLTLRIPAWCATGGDSASVTVNGQPQPGFDRPGFGTLRRHWRDGDLVVLTLPVPLRLEERPSGGVTVQRGPLTFALAVGEDWREIRGRYVAGASFSDWEVHPTSAWNQALVLDPAAPARDFRLERGPVGTQPFTPSQSPLRLRAAARRVPDWTLVQNSAGPVPPSPVEIDTPIEDVTLVPYGCARLRVTELPYTLPPGLEPGRPNAARPSLGAHILVQQPEASPGHNGSEEDLMETRTIVGSGRYTFAAEKQWGRGPGGVTAFGLISGVAGDSQDRVYAFNRLPDPRVLVLDRDGRLLNEWGRGQFKHPHGIWISPQDEIYLTDRDTHLVTRWTLDGRLLQSWGTPDQPGAPGQPFNQPTRAVVTPDGDMFVSDGYGQHRVHRFGKDGRLLHSWGEQGEGPGQFALPHDVWVDPRGRVMICDRENRRIQFFDQEGRYLSEWDDLKFPMQVFIKDDVIYLAEARQQITIMTLDGEVLSRWGSQGAGPDQFTDSPHSIWVDSRGDIYVSEVTSQDKFQKYVRQ